MTHLLSTLREVSLDRHNRAVQGLNDHTLTVALVKHSGAEIRALVRNGDAKEYRVIINDAGALCSCPDAFYHRGPCKHVAAVCVTCLRQAETAGNLIHLMHDNGAVLWGEASPHRTAPLSCMRWIKFPAVSAWRRQVTQTAATCLQGPRW